MLKEWAYAGFIYDLLLAIGIHLAVNDGEFVTAVVSFILLSMSYFYNRKLFNE